MVVWKLVLPRKEANFIVPLLTNERMDVLKSYGESYTSLLGGNWEGESRRKPISLKSSGGRRPGECPENFLVFEFLGICFLAVPLVLLCGIDLCVNEKWARLSLEQLAQGWSPAAGPRPCLTVPGGLVQAICSQMSYCWDWLQNTKPFLL